MVGCIFWRGRAAAGAATGTERREADRSHGGRGGGRRRGRKSGGGRPTRAQGGAQDPAGTSREPGGHHRARTHQEGRSSHARRRRTKN